MNQVRIQAAANRSVNPMFTTHTTKVMKNGSITAMSRALRTGAKRLSNFTINS